jgi:threonyl-tRNA synthetase
MKSRQSKIKTSKIHRAVYGSVERFLGILVENFEGKFPLWLSPVQIILLPIADRHNDYAYDVSKNLKKNGFKVEVDSNALTMNKKIEMQN